MPMHTRPLLLLHHAVLFDITYQASVSAQLVPELLEAEAVQPFHCEARLGPCNCRWLLGAGSC